jgi:hypothetical protein
MIDGPKLIALALAAAAWLTASPSWAEIDGRFEIKGQRVSVTIKTWGEDCGSRPRSYSTGGGKVIEVRHVGANLQIGSQRTDRCWSRNPKIQRQRATVGANRWFVVCETPAADPRFEHGEYTLDQVDENTLRFRDESRYDWRLEGDHCQATVVLTRTYARITETGPEPEPPVAPRPPEPAKPPPREPEKTPPTKNICKGAPGPAVRLEVRPSRAQLAPGERICLKAVGRDAQGCPIPMEASWTKGRTGTTVADAGGRLDGDGCYVAAGSLLEAEGRVMIVATAGDHRAGATLTIRSPDISDLIAASLEEGFEAPDDGELPQAAPARPGAVQGVGRTGVTSEGEPRSLLWAILAGAAVAALLLAVTAVVLLRRRRPQAAIDEEIEAFSQEPEPPAPEGGASPMGEASPEGGASLKAENLICPQCRRGFEPGATVCPRDQTALVPYSAWRESRKKAREAANEGPMVCPVCGSRHDPGTQFCLRDGTKLEPIDPG